MGARGLVRSRSGFTLQEVFLVIVIAAVLITLAVDSIGVARQSTSVRGAAHVLMSMGARARATAIERGHRVELRLDFVGDSAWIDSNGQVLDVTRFDGQGVDLTSTVNNAALCMTPKGYADLDCNSFTGELPVFLQHGMAYLDVTILPLGQILIE